MYTYMCVYVSVSIYLSIYLSIICRDSWLPGQPPIPQYIECWSICQPSDWEPSDSLKWSRNYKGLAYSVLADLSCWLSRHLVSFPAQYFLSVYELEQFCPVATLRQLEQLPVEVIMLDIFCEVGVGYCQEQTCLLVKIFINNEMILIVIFCGFLMLLKTI